ncbi:MAG: RNA polymerase factor sigma-54 [Candidatus Omnitrophica bacterium]|nr:RNA polymerase factor sigma-54 [Candidatus Omnitrophota bacterium]
MQQSIEVLLLPITELNTAIEQELQDNPLLEIDEDRTAREKKQIDDIIFYSLRRNSERSFQSTQEAVNADEENDEEKPVVRTERLEDHLLKQLRLEINDPVQLHIGEFIIGNLDEDGYLLASCEELAQGLLLDDTVLVKKVLTVIQSLDPLGIASRNLPECLLTQISHQFNGKSDLAKKIITEHLDDLSRRKYLDIARKLKISLEDVKHIVKLIAHLEPKPARNFQAINDNIYIKPDITIFQDESGIFHIHIHNENIPHLRISSTYQKILKQPNRSKEEITFIREKIKNALLFLKSIEQRHLTLRHIAEFILNHQIEFFKDGQSSLRPLILKDVAASISRNESTVCRAISNKYMETPHGVFPMKYFFSQAVTDERTGISVGSRSIKEDVKMLISSEDNACPLSDNDIQLHFQHRGMKIARRTISKYRQQMNILPSHLRKN